MKKIRVFVIAVVLIVGICGAFYAVNENAKKESRKEETLTEIQKVSTKDLKNDYPKTPREVIKFFNKIIDCYYKDDYTDDELKMITEQARLLFDAELLAENDSESYVESVRADVKNFKDQGKSIVQIGLCDSSEVYYIEDGDDSIAYVTASYFIKDKDTYTKTYQEYVLRQDEDSEWKILAFYQIEPSEDTEK